MMEGLRYLLEPTKLIVLLLLASLFTFSCSLAELSEVEEAENIATVGQAIDFLEKNVN